MEVKASSLIGMKMNAAQLLYGDEIGLAIVPEDDGDFLRQLARDLLNRTKLADLQTLFADEMQVFTSPLGCPTQTSPFIVPVLPASQTWEEWLRKHSIGGTRPASGKNGKYGNRAYPGQLSIWGEE